MQPTGEVLGNVFQALADPTRLAVVQRLGNGPASTKELAQPFDMALPSFMQHLAVLEGSGLIASEKVGRVRTWQIKPEQLVAVETWLDEQRAQWEGRTQRLTDYVEAWADKEQHMSDPQNEFTVSRLIKAPRRQVWMAWTMPVHLEKWWCPAPVTCRVVNFDPRPGGAFDLHMVMPDGHETYQTGAFLDLVPEERIVFTTALTAEWRPADTPLPITATISMRDEGQQTRYETRVLYRDEEERQQLEQFGFEDGWSLAIEQLAAMLAEWG